MNKFADQLFNPQAYLNAQTAFCDWFRHFHNKPSAPGASEPASLYNSLSISDIVAEEHRLLLLPCFLL